MDVWGWIRRKAVPERDSALVTARPSPVQPPAAWGQASPVWETLWSKVRGVSHSESRLNALQAARDAFTQSLAGIESRAAYDLARRAQHARSLRELWHLRAEAYSVISHHASQFEAEKRIAVVNQHLGMPAGKARGASAKASLPARSRSQV